MFRQRRFSTGALLDEVASFSFISFRILWRTRIPRFDWLRFVLDRGHSLLNRMDKDLHFSGVACACRFSKPFGSNAAVV